jgi:uncharacterized membrane protein
MKKGLRLNYLLVYYALYFIGGFVYVGLELLWRGYSHYTMFIVGGICFLIVGSMNEVVKKPMSLLLQGCIGSVIITLVEFITGCIVNLHLGWNVWDYSDMPLNILGQVCLPFMLLWVAIAILCVVVNDLLLVFFNIREKMPKYKLI